MFNPYIAIGHGVSTDGTWDTGCTWNGYTEAEIAKEVVAGILEVFQANGKTFVTDYPENAANIINCVDIANANNCSHYLSVHLDWDQAPSGILPIIYPGSGEGLVMAEAVRASMKLRIPGLNDRGNLQRDDYEVRSTNMPALIMEIGSIKADNALIVNNTRLFGHSIAYGLMDAAGEPYNVLTDSGSVPVSPPPAVAPVNPQADVSTVSSSGFNWETENIQYFLNICNYGAPDIDGIWGSETEQCLKNAQSAYGIEADGIWGPITQANVECQVRGYQTRLNELGFTCDIDGIAGPGTYQAVKNFQAANGLEVDGIVGQNTFGALFGSAPVNSASSIELRNFEPDEFKCECGCGGDVQLELKQKVQALRDLLTQRAGVDRPLVITSGFRCPYQNERDGGVPDSLHMEGAACDLYTPGMSNAMVDEIAYCAQQVGLGTLKYYSNLFVHVQLYPADRVMN